MKEVSAREPVGSFEVQGGDRVRSDHPLAQIGHEHGQGVDDSVGQILGTIVPGSVGELECGADARIRLIGLACRPTRSAFAGRCAGADGILAMSVSHTISADAPLTEDERLVLDLLMQRDRKPHERTVSSVAADLRWHWTATHTALRALESRTPQLAHCRVDRAFGLKSWFATLDAADLLQSGDA
jgi:hypothetical protein